jgi:hypothetical protein
MGHTLESHKFFPYMAWTLVIAFALFTYTLTLRVQDDSSFLSERVNDHEMRLKELESRSSQ